VPTSARFWRKADPADRFASHPPPAKPAAPSSGACGARGNEFLRLGCSIIGFFLFLPRRCSCSPCSSTPSSSFSSGPCPQDHPFAPSPSFGRGCLPLAPIMASQASSVRNPRCEKGVKTMWLDRPSIYPYEFRSTIFENQSFDLGSFRLDLRKALRRSLRRSAHTNRLRSYGGGEGDGDPTFVPARRAHPIPVDPQT